MAIVSCVYILYCVIIWISLFNLLVTIVGQTSLSVKKARNSNLLWDDNPLRLHFLNSTQLRGPSQDINHLRYDSEILYVSL